MKNLLIYFLLFASYSCFAQKAKSYPVSFNQAPSNDERMVSSVFEGTEIQNQFVVLSAYTYATNKAELYFRLKRDNTWENWQNFDVAHATEQQARQAFEGVFIYKNFESIQFASQGSLNSKVIFRVYEPTKKSEEDREWEREGERKSTNQLEPRWENDAYKTLTACACAQPLICLRDCWCADGSCPKDTTPTPTQVSHLIVHHSAGGNNATDFAAVVASYWDLHVNTNGWDDIGYNWLIDPNGVIYEGRGSGVQGAHFSCMNQNTTGICMIGSYSNQSPSDTAYASLKQLLAWESCDKNIVLTDTSFHASSQLNLAHVSTHRDGNASTAPNSCAVGTVCPGDSLYADYYQKSVVPAANLNCTQGVGLQEHEVLDFTLYPNPVKEIITLQLNTNYGTQPYTFVVYNSFGQVVLRKEVTNGSASKTLNLSGLSAGVYVIQLVQNEYFGTQVFVKE